MQLLKIVGIFCAGYLCGIIAVGWSQTTQSQSPQIPMVIESADADEFRLLIASMGDGPAKALMTLFYNRLQRQQAKQAEIAKQSIPEAPK
jgi:hypothetical protein